MGNGDVTPSEVPEKSGLAIVGAFAARQKAATTKSKSNAIKTIVFFPSFIFTSVIRAVFKLTNHNKKVKLLQICQTLQIMID